MRARAGARELTRDAVAGERGCEVVVRRVDGLLLRARAADFSGVRGGLAEAVAPGCKLVARALIHSALSGALAERWFRGVPCSSAVMAGSVVLASLLPGSLVACIQVLPPRRLVAGAAAAKTIVPRRHIRLCPGELSPHRSRAAP